MDLKFGRLQPRDVGLAVSNTEKIRAWVTRMASKVAAEEICEEM
jgi:hypothetical protein